MPTTDSQTAPQGLQAIIAPEVFHDEFSDAIRNLARSAPIDTVLEIGSSSGEGSTLAWVEGLRQNPRKPKLYCMEVSKVRCEALEKRWGPEGFVECFLGSSVDLEQFPSEAEVQKFYHTVEGPLRNYPLEQVLGWLREDVEYIRKEGVQTGRIREIKRARGIENFGAVLIDGSEFTGNAELDEVYGAEFILLDDTQTYKCHQAHQRLLHDPGYELIAENPALRHGYSVFRRRRRTNLDPLPTDAPVHYFTIVLNGEPFIRHHIEVLKQLPFRWHWHVVEGAATLAHDTAWSKAAGGTLPHDRHRDGLSIDGTTAYLDELAASHPGQISLHRPPAGHLWDGKIEMVAEPIRHIFEDCILWEIDADELWTVEQLEEGRKMFLEHPEKSAAMFWCDFFVGEKLVVSSRHCYSQNPAQEWLRAWSFQPGMKWLKHEPPVLCSRRVEGIWRDLAKERVFTQAETEARGLVFQHFAYATEAQVEFKERYYGYAGAVDGWRRLQKTQHFPALLRDSFPWVEDHTEVDTTDARGITPLAQRNEQGQWTFFEHSTRREVIRAARPVIAVDGVFFQVNNTGIRRVWMETFKEWVISGIARQVWLLDRDGTAPDVPGIQRRRIRKFDPENLGHDSLVLQEACDELGADVFISTYYSCPLTTPCVGMIYDMIPELLNLSTDHWEWKQKEHHILQSRHFACISQSTADDLLRIHPEISPSEVTVTLLAASGSYHPTAPAEASAFRKRHGITKDYILVSGERIGIPIGGQGYKNAALAFRAWSLLPKEERDNIMILCTGGGRELEEELKLLAPDAEVRLIRFSDEDLAMAFSGAVALVYPSLYEGFGLPVIEAMACGCPVITCRRASLVEVAGDAALLVDPWDPRETASAIQSLRKDAALRERHVSAGLAQAAKFSFARMAASLAEVLFATAARPEPLSARRHAKLCETLRRMQMDEANLVRQAGESRRQLAATKGEARQAQKKLKDAKKARMKLEKQFKEERAKRRSPLKHLWRKLRGKKPGPPSAGQKKKKSNDG